MKLLLLPGLDGTGLLFRPLVDMLSGFCEIEIVSYPDDKLLGYADLIEWIQERLPQEDFILLGESFAGPVVYEIACHEPAGLKGAIFVATFLHDPHPVLTRLLSSFPFRFFLSLPIPDYVSRTFFFDSHADESIMALFARAMQKTPPRVLVHRLSEIARLEIRPSVCSLNCTYIQATRDRLVPPGCLSAFRQQMENLVVYRVAGPHFILQSKAEECARIIRLETERFMACS